LEWFRGLAQRNKGRKTTYFEGYPAQKLEHDAADETILGNARNRPETNPR
jgi:hypothetical protein